jgi:hypothetical protein
MSSTSDTTEESPPSFQLRALGFCGVDDSIHPYQLAMYSHSYPFVEWGVLFRPDREGTPRYASSAFVERLAAVATAAATNHDMKLAAHLCGERVHQVLVGDDSFLRDLSTWGFGRVQINATAVNGVDTSRLATSVPAFLAMVARYPALEFILQKNDETKPLWDGILQLDDEALAGRAGSLPKNVSMLLDESKGTGVLASSWPEPPTEYKIGYAGGIGPDNITSVLGDVSVAAAGREVWIDMESRLRSEKNGKDVFDLDKCYQVIDAVCQANLHSHPSFLTVQS